MAVAVKRFHACTKNMLARDDSFQAERRLIGLSHANIVRVLASSVGTRPGDAIIVMEYAGDCNLQQLINETDEPFDILTRIRYSLDIAQGLDYIHRNCVVHLDLKPANVIVSPKDICKLADFGCCQQTEGNTGMVSPTNRSHLTGTFAYRAPELFRGKPPTTKADVYALGVTMWQLLAIEQPYSGKPQECVIFAVVSSNLRPKLPDKVLNDPYMDVPVEEFYMELYKQCWDANIMVRPCAEDLVEVLALWRDEVVNCEMRCWPRRGSINSDYDLYSYTRDEDINLMDIM